MKNLLNKSAQIDYSLTSDPISKQGETGIITQIEVIDQESF